MEAGRELDTLIAEKVMGQNPDPEPTGHLALDMAALDFPNYSTDIVAAWQVVERIKDKFKASDAQFDILYRTNYPPNEWIVGWRVCHDYGDRFHWEFSDLLGYAEADTAPLAICLAALKAVGA